MNQDVRNDNRRHSQKHYSESDSDRGMYDTHMYRPSVSHQPIKANSSNGHMSNQPHFLRFCLTSVLDCSAFFTNALDIFASTGNRQLLAGQRRSDLFRSFVGSLASRVIPIL